MLERTDRTSVGKRVGRMESISGGRRGEARVVFEEQIGVHMEASVLSCAGFLNSALTLWAALCFVAGLPCVVWDA